MWQFFQTKYHFYQGVFKYNENSLIFTAKKKVVSFSEDGGQDSGLFNNRRADSGHFFRDIGTFFICVYNVGSDLNLHLLEEPSQ